MKFKLTEKGSTNALILLGGVVVGSMLSDGIMAVLPASAQTSIVKGATAVGSGVLAAGIDGDDTLAKVTRSTLLGMAVKQSLNVLKAEVGPKVATTSNPTTVQKFVNASFGMGAAKYTPRRRSALRAAVIPRDNWENKPVAAMVNEKVPHVTDVLA